ncbi:hypothetical protein [Tunturiibacter gelidiferens]|uniref:hypothetical protein n=1 Tax=Tunturiibacter gelidiferens TaxID=3069689 RepID=UPI003D9BA182
MPTLEEARVRLAQVLKFESSTPVALKLIHGYGSSGKGGVLRDGIRKSLLLRQKEGLISFFVTGEKWSIFELNSQRAMEMIPQLRSDSDLEKWNRGITIVVIGVQNKV